MLQEQASPSPAAIEAASPFRRARYLTLTVTRGCNLACEYCKASARGEAAPRMQAGLACMAVARFLRETEETDLWINFHGGEPLLMEDGWFERVTQFAREQAADLGKTVRFPLSSNGLLLDEDRARRLLAMGLEFSLSLDGPPHVHDRRRQGGEGTARALRLLQRLGAAPHVSLVLHRANVQDLPAIFRWFQERGLRAFQMNFLEHVGRGEAAMGLSAGAMVAAVQEMTQLMLENALALTCNDVLALARRFLSPGAGPAMRCQAGTAMLAVDPQGCLAPCASAPDRSFRLGHVAEPDLGARRRGMRQRFHDRHGFEIRCFDCPAGGMCRFPCPVAGASRVFRERHCLFIQLLHQAWNEQPGPARRLGAMLEARSASRRTPSAPPPAPLPPICLKR